MDKIIIKNIEDFKKIDKTNKLVLDDIKSLNMINSLIAINGENNIIHIEENVVLENTNINIEGNGNIIYISSNSHHYKLDISIYNNSIFYIGKNNYINGKVHCVMSEQKNIIIGDNGLFSFDIWLRLADPHLIYDTKTHKRINNSKSIYIGDHVWVGQHAMVLKGAKIGSGSIIGALAITSSTVSSNVIVSGNPAKVSKENIFWDGKCVHRWLNKDTKDNSIKNSDDDIYEGNSDLFNNLESYFTENIDNTKAKYEYLLNNIVKNNDKNRFSIKIKKSFIDKLKIK